MTDPRDIEPPPAIVPRTTYFNGSPLPFAMWMYTNALWQIRKQQFAAGVLLAQVAVEMGALDAFTSLIVRREGPVDDAIMCERVPSLSFLERPTRRLWTELTGHSVTQPKDTRVWANYQKHVEYRNAIAHGTVWGDSKGWESVAAAGQFILRLDEHMRLVDEADPEF